MKLKYNISFFKEVHRTKHWVQGPKIIRRRH